jgi:hypothetical protein
MPRNSQHRPRRLLRLDNAPSRQLHLLDLFESPDVSYNYVALSHCWGQDSGFELSTMPKTIKENLVFHKSEGLSEQDLTRTFRDAIDVTRKLGVQYLWIDSLCIVQDNAEDMETELSKMGGIYGNAYLVIAATLAKDGSVGLDCERLLFNFEISDSHGQAVKAAVREKSYHDVWKKGEQFWTVRDLPLFDRAWAFQERLLARRVVHFTPVELVWECRTCIDCECGDLSNPRTSWPEFGIGKNLKTKYADVTRWGSDMDRINFWHVLCAQYSSRKITKTTDRLPALSSSAKAMDMPPYLGRYLAGIWECTLPNGLLWWSEYTNSKLYPSGSKTHWRKRPCPAPTWTWLSIEGRVSTWGMYGLSLVTILDVSYQVINDPYSSCQGGTIVVRGVAVPVEIVDAKRTDGPSSKEVRLYGKDESFDFFTDTNPFEYVGESSEDEELLALQFAASDLFIYSIILKRVPQTTDHYERLGIAHCTHEWFWGQKFRIVVLV